jgi:hypothetical protein
MRAHAEEARITVVIPSTDRRLVRWENWMRKHCHPAIVRVADETAKKIGIDWRAWYVYFGAVPLSRFRVVDYADPDKRAGRET